MNPTCRPIEIGASRKGKPCGSRKVYFADFNHKEKSKEILSIELLKSTGGAPSPEVIFHDDVKVVERIKQGDVMGAIRAHRSIHGSGFEESRAVVDDIQSRLGISSRNNR